MQKKQQFTTKRITTIGMLAAMVVISTMIKIPYGNGAMVHLGSAAIFTAGLVFGSFNAGLAGAIGSAFYDLFMGLSPYTLWSFVIKGAAGYTVGYIYHHKIIENRLYKAITACLVAAIITLIGYFVAWSFVAGMPAAVTNIPSSLISSGVGTVVAMPLSTLLRSALKNANLI